MWRAQAKMPPYVDQSTSWSREKLAGMTLREKIGQLFFVAITSHKTIENESLASQATLSYYRMSQPYIEHLIQDYHIGGVIMLCKNNLILHINLTNHYQSVSTLPLIVSEDCEWGLSMRLRDVIEYPRNMTLGAIQDESLIYELGKEIGRQCKTIGVHWNFAPVIDVNNNPANPVINNRSFGQDKERVAYFGTLLMQGMQDAGIVTCAKHFPGHGDTDIDSHFELPLISHSKERLNDLELYPFKKLIHAGVDAIMNAHLTIPVLDGTHEASSLSYPIVTDLLKKELGFNGLIVTDALGMEAITKYNLPGELELKALLAGNDVLLCPVDVPKAVELIEQAIASGIFSEQELDKRVLKILQTKECLGLHQQRYVDPTDVMKTLHTEYAYDLKRRLYRAAITLVKKDSNMPARGEEASLHILQIGGAQQSVFVDALKSAYPLSSIQQCSSTLSEEMVDGIVAACDAQIVIVGLFDMNKFKNKNFGIAQATLQVLNKLDQQGKTVILALFGSPYSLALCDKQDVIVMAYEDAMEAQQAAVDCITGQLHPSGTLPVTASDQFVCGYGLR